METAPTSVEVQSIDWEDQWYPIHLTDDLDTGAPNAFTLLGKGIVIWLDATVCVAAALQTPIPAPSRHILSQGSR